jgi:predicted aconitase with swiveling domain
MKFKAKIIQGWKNDIVGEVLITKSKISFLGDVDINTGKIVGSDIDLKGESIKDKILIFPEGRGSTVGSNVIYGLSRKGLAPKLIATCRAEPITISGAIYGEVPMISNISEKIFDKLKNHDTVKVTIANGEAFIEKTS